MFKEFKAFVMRGNVIDLAVGVVIGAAFKTVVDSFVADVLTPIIGIFGSQDFSTLSIHLKDGVDIHYGAFINALISFVMIAAAVFFFIVKPLNMLAERRKRGEEPAPEELSLDQELLTEIRDLLRSRNSA